MQTQAGRAVIGLLLVALTWGSSFPLTKVVLAEVSTADFLAVRFAIATVFCGIVFFSQIRRLDGVAWRRAIGMGVLYGAGQLLQTQGLTTTPAAVSGFITGLYVVLTPICAALLLKARTAPRVWVAAGLATAGLGLLSLNGSLGVGTGELLTIASALVYSVHIVAVSHWSTPSTAVGSSVVQMLVITVMSGAAALPGGISVPRSSGVWWALLYMAVFSGALALVVQVWAQAHLEPSRAAIVMSSEPLWAAVLSVSFFGEEPTWRLLVGGAAILTAMLVVELGPARRPRRRGPPGEDHVPPGDAVDVLGEDLPSPPR